jgi:hypothetical protein
VQFLEYLGGRGIRLYLLFPCGSCVLGFGSGTGEYCASAVD